jgi:hypothetical protein
MLQNIFRGMNSINFGCNTVKLFHGTSISDIVNKKRINIIIIYPFMKISFGNIASHFML